MTAICCDALRFFTILYDSMAWFGLLLREEDVLKPPLTKRQTPTQTSWRIRFKIRRVWTAVLILAWGSWNSSTESLSKKISRCWELTREFDFSQESLDLSLEFFSDSFRFAIVPCLQFYLLSLHSFHGSSDIISDYFRESVRVLRILMISLQQPVRFVRILWDSFRSMGHVYILQMQVGCFSGVVMTSSSIQLPSGFSRHFPLNQGSFKTLGNFLGIPRRLSNCLSAVSWNSKRFLFS